jgi:hypothetical protein
MPAKKVLDIEKMKRLYSELGSVVRVAQAIKVSPETVRIRLMKAGVKLRSKGRPKSEETIDGATRVRRHRARKAKYLPQSGEAFCQQ